MMAQSAYVYLHHAAGAVLVGIVETLGEGRSATARFRYGRSYLQRKDAFALDPVQLPLIEGALRAPEGFALFNGLRDAAPDGWGRHLMDRAAGGRVLTEFDYLVATSDDRVGALAFGSDRTGPDRIVAWENGRPSLAGEQLDLAAMLEAVREVDTADELPPEHRRFLKRGSSLGGARPKAATDLDGKAWIAKFGRAEDRYPVCRSEYAAMTLAARVGLNVPEVRLETVLGQDIYLVERFDRKEGEDGVTRTPFISGLTLLGAHESESSLHSYRALAEQLRIFGAKPTEDARELWRRMLFNILCNNTDDHLRNHGFLRDERGWRLSPAYDIVPLPQVATERDLAIGVGKQGRRATLRNALSEAASFGLSRDEARALTQGLCDQVKAEWESVFRNAGITGNDLERLRTCFAACDEVDW